MPIIMWLLGSSREKAYEWVHDLGGMPGAWSHWLASFEALVKDRGLLSEEEILERTAEFLAEDEHHH